MWCVYTVCYEVHLPQTIKEYTVKGHALAEHDDLMNLRTFSPTSYSFKI